MYVCVCVCVHLVLGLSLLSSFFGSLGLCLGLGSCIGSFCCLLSSLCCCLLSSFLQRVMVKVDEGRDGDDVGDWHGMSTRAGVIGDEGRVMGNRGDGESG